jgi:hypothetical protein
LFIGNDNGDRTSRHALHDDRQREGLKRRSIRLAAQRAGPAAALINADPNPNDLIQLLPDRWIATHPPRQTSPQPTGLTTGNSPNGYAL